MAVDDIILIASLTAVDYVHSRGLGPSWIEKLGAHLIRSLNPRRLSCTIYPIAPLLYSTSYGCYC